MITDPNTTFGGRLSSRERIRVTPLISTKAALRSQIKGSDFQSAGRTMVNAPLKRTLRAAPCSLNSFPWTGLSLFQKENGLSVIWHLIVSAELLAVWWILVRNRNSLGQTTLIAAWRWSLVAASAWTITWLTDCCGQLMSPAAADHAWYFSTVLALCPPIAVLGSRRPGNRVWEAFILLPMLMALFWPILAVRLQGSEFRGLQLETPQFVAFTLVLVMGIGNYCGTRYTLQALIFGTAVLAITAVCSQSWPWGIESRPGTRVWGTALAGISIISTRWTARPQPQSDFDRVWFDFFDTFGIVWGRRIQDRINFVAQKEDWPVRLDLHGFVEADRFQRPPDEDLNDSSILAALNVATVRARMEHTLRWLLRRFVDPIWIDQRLHSSARDTQPQCPVDS